jgi:molybdopterin-guanine dinucleotide biosynthesis protein A
MRGQQEYAAVVLAGGAGRRLGGAGKPELPVAGESMLRRVLAAVAGASARIVVGPPRLVLPPGVLRTREQPPGGGPAAAAAAGFRLLPPEVDQVALLASDLPFLTPQALRLLLAAAAERDGAGNASASDGADGAGSAHAAGRAAGADGAGRAEAGGAEAGRAEAGSAGAAARAAGVGAVEGAVYVDAGGRPQWLCGVWSVATLRARLAALPTDLSGTPIRRLLAELRYVSVTASGAGPPPWWDCDTEDDLRQAKEWADGGAG